MRNCLEFPKPLNFGRDTGFVTEPPKLTPYHRIKTLLLVITQ
jgi:hypothetical protein